MKKIKYGIRIYDENGNNQKLDWRDLESLPRFEVGDYIDEYFFNPMCDNGWLSIVVESHYHFSINEGKPEIELTLRIRSETGHEQGERLRKLGVIG
jgi:hypothetical protein